MNLRNKQVTIIGMGRSALGAARLLLREGARPFVSELKTEGAVETYRAALEGLGVPYELGGHTARAWEADLVVLSPGVPAAQPAFSALRQRGVPVLGELELGYRFCQSKILAVTGTNGKTTTTELLRHLLAHCGHRVALAGNNDTPLCEAVLETPAPEYLVVEVSSYQLETVEQFWPWIAAVINLSPDHLGRHQTMSGYAAAKARIFARQGAGDIAVVNQDDAWTMEMAVPAGVALRRFSLSAPVQHGLWSNGAEILEGDTVVARAADNPLPGRHNLANVLAALTMLRGGGFDWERCVEGLRSFRGVEHRIELVAEHAGVRYYNDSKSTNVDSLRVALESFAAPVVLIAGGEGKEGSDYAALRPLLAAHARAVVLLGEAAPAMAAAWDGAAPLLRVGAMAEAVETARAQAAAGSVVLLSPGCASFDQYRNFEERGRDFKQCVAALLGAAAPDSRIGDPPDEA